MKFLAISFAMMLASCASDTIVQLNSTPEAPRLLINEIMIKGSEQVNEFGGTADWIELYNPTEQSFIMESGQWFVSDHVFGNPEKFELPVITIPAKGYALIWCDAKNTINQQIHTNFKLSSDGENIGLFYRKGKTVMRVDALSFRAVTSNNVSFGRRFDGAGEWMLFNGPTPGSANNTKSIALID